MISNNYPKNIQTRIFKETKNIAPEIREKILKKVITPTKKQELLRTLNRGRTQIENDISTLNDPWVPLSEKLETVGSGFSKLVAKILKYFYY